jgi:glutaredoxin
MKESKTFLLVLLGAILLMLGIYLISAHSARQNYDIESLAKCLHEKNTTMYGAYWCPHCQNEKRFFGQYFSYIDYIECEGADGSPQKCLAEGVQGYPTWKIEGRFYAGEKSISELKKISGC